MFSLTFTRSGGVTFAKTLQSVETLADVPKQWREHARRGLVDYDAVSVRLHFGGASGARNVYSDSEGLFVLQAGARVRVPGGVAATFGAFELWRATDQGEAKPRRRGRPMPETLAACDVESVLQWPLGSVKTSGASGENWTDCLIVFVDAIRVGGAHNSRRVRYDGVFYVMHNGRRVQIGGALALHVLDVASHVYGVDAESDKMHNKTLKGY